jgi:hypothetical protein
MRAWWRRPEAATPLWVRVLDKTAESRRWRFGVLIVATLLTAAFAVAAILTIHNNTLRLWEP